MEAAFVETTDGFAKTLAMLPEIKNAEARLRSPEAAAMAAPERQALRDAYEKAVDQGDSVMTPRAMCGRVLAAYRSPEPSELCSQLARELELVGLKQDLNEALLLHDQAWQKYELLVSAMALELRRSL
jgi:hypothetical protein